LLNPLSRAKFAETQLPSIEAFRDNLKDEDLKEEDYERAKQTWSRFHIQNLQQYHDHYLLTDVLLLADVVEHFRQTRFLVVNNIRPALQVNGIYIRLEPG